MGNVTIHNTYQILLKKIKTTLDLDLFLYHRKLLALSCISCFF